MPRRKAGDGASSFATSHSLGASGLLPVGRKQVLRLFRDAQLMFRGAPSWTRAIIAILMLLAVASISTVLLTVGESQDSLPTAALVADHAQGIRNSRSVDEKSAVQLAIEKALFSLRGNDNAVEGGVEELQFLLSKIVPNITASVADPSSSLPLHRNPLNVTVIAVNYAYRELAMNLICNFKRLSMDNYVVLAMDRAVFRYVANRKGNVFYNSAEAAASMLEKAEANDIDSEIYARQDIQDSEMGDDQNEGDLYGTAGFVHTSQRKSMMLAEVVMLGYDVLFCDADVLLYKNPHDRLSQYADDFVIMSDRRHSDPLLPLNHNLNSGFYFVRGKGRNFLTLRAIVKYGLRSKRSEQKAFNHVLCGGFKNDISGPGWRFGDNRCFYRAVGGVSAHVLMTEEFPNGSDERIFQLSPQQIERLYPHIYALHVNYVRGRNAKIDRIKRIGQWFFDPEAGTGLDGCLSTPNSDILNRDLPDPELARNRLER
jgi:hypothetical protein